ncbi:MAG: hypothetical protein FWB95_06365 [Treponema sp.]|nr:hypothetical protein [Treponema sp.]
MKKLTGFLACILLVFTGLPYLYCAETGAVEFNIRFFDRRIYYVESDPILIQITITNNSPSVYRFKLADDRAFSVDFDIRSMANRTLPMADILLRKRTQNSQVFFREIAIESGESFSFVEDIRNYVSFGQHGSFRVRAKVYPELFKTTNAPFPLESNYLSLNLRPAVIHGQDGLPIEMDIATGAVLARQNLPPDEVITYMLIARQRSQWERFFLYLDIESMLRRDAFQSRKYNAENEEGRRRMVNEYREKLMITGDPHAPGTSYDNILTTPTTFEILRTQYNHNEATVIVLQKYRMINYTELRHYTYFLEKQDNYWAIVNYSVQGMGTEGND